MFEPTSSWFQPATNCSALTDGAYLKNGNVMVQMTVTMPLMRKTVPHVCPHSSSVLTMSVYQERSDVMAWQTVGMDLMNLTVVGCVIHAGLRIN